MKETKPKFLDKLEENQLAQEINSIEEINNPVIKEYNNNPEPIEEITPTPEPVITEEPIAKAVPKNTVRIMDGNFTF